MFGNVLSPIHIILLLVVVLLIFGPRRLPELGGAVGKTIKEFQKSMAEARGETGEGSDANGTTCDGSTTTGDHKPN